MVEQLAEQAVSDEFQSVTSRQVVQEVLSVQVRQYCRQW
jgi:hypothetical protein